jgi:hypothetical protein
MTGETDNAGKNSNTAIAIANMFGRIFKDKIDSAVGKGQGYTFDESYTQNQEKLGEVERISGQVGARCVALPQHISEELRKDKPGKEPEIKKLEELWNNKLEEIEKAIAQKILEERLEEERRLQKQHLERVAGVAEGVNKNIEDEKNENADSLKYRIFASLIFSGILDVTDILECVLNIFGVNDDFAKAVGEVVANNELMSFIGKVNHAFGIDKLVELVSRAPILNDINQTALELTKTDAFQTFSPLAKEAFTGDFAEFATRTASAVQFFTSERGLQINHEQRSKENDEKIRELEEIIREESKPDAVKIATRVIEVETRFRLDEIYIRNYLKAVFEDGQEINDGDKIKLGHFMIRDENKGNCGTLLDKINEAKDETDKAKKISKIKEILELVVKDEARNNMDVLDLFREVARESFYKSSQSNQSDIIEAKREKYLKEDVLKDLEKVGNEYKIDEAKKALTEAIKAKYVGNAEGIKEKNIAISALSNADEFANFIKNEFQDRKEFDDIVIKIAISVQKDEIAQTVVRSPFHRVRPKAEISGGDAMGRNVTHVATGQSVGAGGPAALEARPAGPAGPTGASPSL